MASNIAFAACVFFAAHGALAGVALFGREEARHAPWLYATNWALAWAFAYLAMI